MGYWDDEDEDDWYAQLEQCRNIPARILYETNKTSLFFLLSALIHLLDTEPVKITEDERGQSRELLNALRRKSMVKYNSITPMDQLQI